MSVWRERKGRQSESAMTGACTERSSASRFGPSASIGIPTIFPPCRRINEIVHGKRGITADTALRLARYFGTSERFWLNLQSRYEIEVERDRLTGVLDEIEPLVAG